MLSVLVDLPDLHEQLLHLVPDRLQLFYEVMVYVLWQVHELKQLIQEEVLTDSLALECHHSLVHTVILKLFGLIQLLVLLAE